MPILQTAHHRQGLDELKLTLRQRTTTTMYVLLLLLLYILHYNERPPVTVFFISFTQLHLIYTIIQQ